MIKKLLVLFIPVVVCAQLPGPKDNRVLLPNGWWLSPAGEQIELGDFPMNAAVYEGKKTDEGKYFAVLEGGQSGADVRLVDLNAKKVVQVVKLEDAWQGIRFSSRRLYVSGGYQNCVYTFDLTNGKLVPVDTLRFEDPKPKYDGGVAGLDVLKNTVAAVMRNDSTLRVFHLVSRKSEKLKLEGMPYDCEFMENGHILVSLWSSSKVQEFNGTKLVHEYSVGDHPNEISLSANSHYAYVANANDNTVSVIDLKRGATIAHVSTAIHPDSPEGSTTNSVTLVPRYWYLIAANADNNSLTVMKWQNPRHPRPIGFIPTGWYPTKVLALKDGTLLVLNGKGGRSLPNPNHEYIASLFKGTLSIFKAPLSQQLAEYTKQVYENTPYKPEQKKEAGIEPGGPLPDKVGGDSPIKYVFYFIRENRTYDQVLGDVQEGNGDSSLTIFGKRITPNAHKISQEFVLFDNFYVNSEVSADGHNWSTAAYATDYIEKVWPSFYGGRGGVYNFEGEERTGHPKAGFIWDQCARQNVSYRDYGEFIETAPTVGDAGTPNTASLIGHFSPTYRGWDLDYSDVDRYNAWDKEFTEFEKNGDLPRFNIFHLPNDHTAGTARGKLTPQAYVAQNDYALGLFVDRISHSKFWSQSVIFVIEDDAQNGPDHVDAHRSVALVVSPYLKRHYVDHTLYTGASMLRTMELILGLPPMSQYDAAATPMAHAFTSTPTLTPYTADTAEYDLTTKNKEGDYGQNLMEHMNLTKEDAVPDELFNEIIWRSIKGTPMPPPRYSILSGPASRPDDD